MTDKPPPARIQRIEVKGLFGLYDHVIDLKLEDRVTILHGPNGVGKTVLLRMIHALATGDLKTLVQIPFVHFRLTMLDGTSFSARTSPRTIKRHTKEETARILTLSAERDGAALMLPAELAFFRQRRAPVFAFNFGATGAADEDARTVELFQGEQWHEDPRFSDPGDVLTALARVPIRVIGVERLIEAPAARTDDDDDTPLPAIWGCSIDLKQRIARDWIDYGELAQELDRSYPRRLLGHKAPPITVDELKRRMTALEQKREELRAIGLLDEERVPPFDLSALDSLDPTQMGVMTLYVEDTARKLGALDDLVDRLSLLLRTVNARFRNKSVRADPREGLALSTHDRRPLDLRALSSGEQHQLVLLYNLLFRVPAGALVLIDEPELSLHVLWQKRFLPTLLEIVRIAEIDALVATHSPFIVGERSDLMVALDAEIDHDGPVQP